jgi:hypothetical protein
MKFTFEEAVSLLKEMGNEIGEYMDGWCDHEQLGKPKTLSSEIVGYYEGNVETFQVVQFENCDEPIGYLSSSNSWDDYGNEPGTFHKVHKETVEVWKITK